MFYGLGLFCFSGICKCGMDSWCKIDVINTFSLIAKKAYNTFIAIWFKLCIWHLQTRTNSLLEIFETCLQSMRAAQPALWNMVHLLGSQPWEQECILAHFTEQGLSSITWQSDEYPSTPLPQSWNKFFWMWMNTKSHTLVTISFQLQQFWHTLCSCSPSLNGAKKW